jgi:enamine deaminase RidA (YjgF/YER057c/UK114 family)
VPAVLTGSLLFVSGQLPFCNGAVFAPGILGADVGTEDGKMAARHCGLNILAQAKTVLGDLDRIVQLVRLGGFVASTPGFTDQSLVINGASDLMVEILGDAGRHARAAVGVASLPRGAAVEVEAIFEVH